MGIETFAAIASIAGAVGGLVMGGKKPNLPDAAPAAAAAPEKQADKAPGAAAFAKRNASAAGPGGSEAGASTTLLTGVGGVDPGSLTLGKNTLLGQA